MIEEPISLSAYREKQRRRLMPSGLEEGVTVDARYRRGWRRRKAWKFRAVTATVQSTKKGNREVTLKQRGDRKTWSIDSEGFHTSGYLWWHKVGYLSLPHTFGEFVTDGSEEVDESIGLGNPYNDPVDALN